MAALGSTVASDSLSIQDSLTLSTCSCSAMLKHKNLSLALQDNRSCARCELQTLYSKTE